MDTRGCRPRPAVLIAFGLTSIFFATAFDFCLVARAQSDAITRSPAEYFEPQVILTRDDRAALAAGRAVARTVSGESGEVAVFSAIRVAATPDVLVSWIHRIEELKRSEYVKAIGRFSVPPRLADLTALVLDDEDLDEVRRCRPGDCGVKLSGPEILELRGVAEKAGDSWRRALREAFRRTLLARAERYLRSGLVEAQYHDQSEPVSLAAEFDRLLEHSSFLRAHSPRLAAHLAGYPARRDPAFENFLYWSMEVLGGRPVVSLTHVTIARNLPAPAPPVVVAARQVYASHYMTGSLALTALTSPEGADAPFLIYLNRSRLDVLDGFFGGLVRRIVQRRLRGEAAEVIDGLRRRLEGNPPH